MKRTSRPSDRPRDRGRRRPAEPALVFSRHAVREIDRLAVERYAMPSIVLMENAAIHAADVALGMMRRPRRGSVAIFCGPGNNGGDGLAIARHLHNAGVDVGVVLAASRYRYAGDAATNLTICERMGVPMLDASGPEAVPATESWLAGRSWPQLAVDALLGTGLARPVREPIAGLIGVINGLSRRGAPVLAVDIPSGLDADTGEPLGAAVRATVTVTFVGLKAGFLSPAARGFVGRCRVAEIGIPRRLAEDLATARAGIEPPARRPVERGTRIVRRSRPVRRG